MPIPQSCKRLAEVDFPIAEVSKHAAREKSIRHGHPSTLHLWWARRPLASSRAVLMALLLPDPADPACPPDFKTTARRILKPLPGTLGEGDLALRSALLGFIADFANWDMAANATYLQAARELVKAAHPEETPLVVDPFAGGGSIPLEALRLGCDAFASDLNPVAVLINKVMLEDIPRWGREKVKVKRQNGEVVEADGLAEALRIAGAEVKAAAEAELAEFYPPDPDGAKPIAYIWARTVRCEAPRCGAEIPLARSFWLSKKANRKRALRYEVKRQKGEGKSGMDVPSLSFEIFEPARERDVPGGTVSRARASCPCCGTVLPPERVRAQLAAQRGGADVVFDGSGRRTGGATLLAVVTLREWETGRHYRLPTAADYRAAWGAQQRLAEVAAKPLPNGLNPVPDEPLPPIGTLGFRVQRYGMLEWGDLFSARQKLALVYLIRIASTMPTPISRLFALACDRCADYWSSLCSWHLTGEKVNHTFGRQALPMIWDYTEVNPWCDSSGNFLGAVEWGAKTAESIASILSDTGQISQLDAAFSTLPDESSQVWFTDPPYYDAVPYADLSDFFFVWLKRTLSGDSIFHERLEATHGLTPKTSEIVQDETKFANGKTKGRTFFENAMAAVFSEGYRSLRSDGVGSVVFAHKTTEGWEALLSGLVTGGWTITGSWPLATEMGARLRARDSAALATSIHLIVRPRPADVPIGDWVNVQRALPRQVGAWMERLQGEGVRGADLVFACIGPALEIYSRYRQVVDAQDRPIPLGGDPAASEPHLRGYLAYVWETVARLALEQVLGGAGGSASSGAADGLEEDARLTALFLWTKQSTDEREAAQVAAQSAVKEEVGDDEEGEEDDPDEEDEAPARSSRATGRMSLPFDVVRRFAQPLGIHLPVWEGRMIETEKGVVRLLGVGDRAKQLFGADGADAVAVELENSPLAARKLQLSLFGEAEAPTSPVRGRRRKNASVSDEELRTRQEATTLDRLHAAMLLQQSGRTNALRALLQAEAEQGPMFLRLANALSGLYPGGSEEKRLVDAMLLAYPK